MSIKGTRGIRGLRTDQINLGNGEKIRLRGSHLLLLERMKFQGSRIQFNLEHGRFTQLSLQNVIQQFIDPRIVETLAGQGMVRQIRGSQPPTYELGEKADRLINRAKMGIDKIEEIVTI